MLQNLALGAIVGGIVVFAWGAFSWMVLPWHHATFLRFEDESAVARVVSENAPRSGVYGLPAPSALPPGASSEERTRAETEAWERMKSGPTLFAVVGREGFGSIGPRLVAALAIGVLASLLFTWLLLQTTGLGYFGRAAFIAVGGMAGAVICRLPDWNWHGFSGHYTAVSVADATIGWLLTGLAIAAVVQPAVRP